MVNFLSAPPPLPLTQLPRHSSTQCSFTPNICLYDRLVQVYKSTFFSLIFFERKLYSFISRVMCFHPWSDITLPLMSIEEILEVVREWIRQYQEMGKIYRWVQVICLV